MDTESSVIEYACTDILKNSLRNRRHHVKKQYFDNVEASKVSIKSPVSDITDTEWQRLVELWSTPRHKVCKCLTVALPCPCKLCDLLYCMEVMI